MPIVSSWATRDDRPIMMLLACPTEARSDALAEGGIEIKMKSVRVLIDTGATDSCIERSLAEELDLDPIGEVDVHGVTSGGVPETGIVYRLRFFHAGVPAVELASSVRVVAVEDLGRFDSQVLMGRDLMAKGVLVYDGPQERFTFAF
jgi:Aspartyl protease